MNIRLPNAAPSKQDPGLGPRVPEASGPTQLPALGSAEFFRTFGQMPPDATAAAATPSVADTKRATVAENAEAKQLLLGGADEFRRLGTAIREGNDLADDEAARIIAGGNPYDILTHLGPDALGQVEPLYRQMRDDAFALDQGRTTGEITGDALLGIGAGAVSGLGGLAALGAGAINDRAGAVVSEGVDWAAGGLRGLQSQELQDQREIGAVRSSLDQDDIDRQYQRDVEAEVSYPGLRRFGREAIAAGADLLDNPALAGDLVAEGVGSLVGGGGLGRVAAVGGARLLLRTRGIVGQSATAFLRSAEGRRMVAELAERGMPLSIGGLEAGGAYVGIQGEIQAMDEGELLENSPEYRELRTEGLGHEDARDRIANLAGLEGGAIAGLVGVATGSLVARFEANPLNLGRRALPASRSMVDSLRSIGRESLAQGVEEGVQGAAGSLAQNLAIRDYADESRDLTRGMGAEALRGAVAGVGMVAPLRAPDLAFGLGNDLTRGAVEGAKAAGRAASTAIDGRLRNVEAGIDARSPVGRNAFDQAMTTLGMGLQTVRESVQESIAGRAPEPDLQDLAERAQAVLSLDPESLRDAVRMMESGELSQEDEADTALDIYQRAEQLGWITEQDLGKLTPEARAAMREVRKAVNIAVSNPTVAAAVRRAQTIVSSKDLGTLPDVTLASADTPEVQKVLTATVRLAEANPAGIDPRFVKQVLNQRNGLKLSDAVRAKLEAAALIVREMERADRQKAQILTATEAELARRGLSEKPRKTTDMVRQEILNTGGKDPYKQYSLSRHQSEIVGAIEHGDRKIAQDRFDALGNFAHHMGNKVVAAEQSAALKKSRDNTVLFRTWTGVKWLEASEKGASGIFINPFSPNNIQLLKELRVDAATVKSVYNNLLSIYGPTAGLQGERFGNSGSNTGTTHAEPREAMDDQDEIVAQEANGELRAEGQGEAHRLKPESEQADPGPAEGATRNGDDRILPEGAEPDPRDDGGEPETGADPETVSEESQADTEGETEGETTEATANETLNKTLVQSGPNFGNLASVGGTTPKFARTFDIDPEASPLIAEEAPARKVLEILRDGSSKDERFTLPHFVDKGQIQAWDRVIAREGQALIQRVNDKLRSRDKGILKNLKGMTPLEALDQALVGQGSVNWLDYRDTLGLNLVAPATQAYDARLVQLAMLASLHWFMTTPGTQNLDDDEVAKVFGRSVSDVTEAMRRAANSGRGVKPSVESLARVIRDFWGATPKPDAPISDVRGLSEHMAIQFLDAMDGEDGEDGEAGKFTTSQTFEIPDGDGKTVTARVIYLRNEATSKLRDDVKASKSLLGDMFVPKTAKPLYFGRPPEERRTTQKGNALSPLGEKMRAALKVQRETPFYRNQPQVQMMKALGQDTWFALMGFRAVNEARVNVIDRLSIEGLNNSIRDSWDGVMGYDAQLDAYAEAQAQNPAEVPVHFDFYAASNERMMIEGFNPQADKAMREVAVATRSRLNLLDEKQHEAFWLTVGQSSGLVETEKGSRTANAAAAESKIRARFPESIAILESWLADTTRPLDLEARRVLTSEIRSALGAKNASPKLMHALLSVARYDQVMADTVPGDSEAAENFEHALSLEADGKTDGPINAIVNFTTGKFSADWVLNVRRGGFFPNEQGQTLNGQFDRDDHDLYKLAGVRANALFAERRLHLARTTAGSQMIGALQRVLGILGDVEIGDDGTVQITRKGIKNPLTITGYGSGEKGIAGKVTSAMLERLYAAMTRMEEQRVTYGNQQVGLDAALPGMASLDQFRKDLSLLTRRRLIPNRERGWVLVPTNQKGQEAGPLMNLNDGRNFKLSPEQFSILQANIQVGYVKPMRRAIAEVFGNAQRTLNLFQQTTQIQSLVLKDLFWKRVKDLRAARKVSGELTAGQFLSQEDFQKISEDLKKYGAFIEPVDSNESSLNLSIAEGEQTTVEFSRDFDGRYAGGSTLPAPRLAGVSASPMVTISRGDAKMMVSFFGDEGALEAGARRTLQVYDGLEMPADLIETLSERINKAVADAWLESPAKDVAESFSDWIRQGKDGPLGEVSDDAVGAIIEILGVKPEDASTAISRDDVNAALLNLEDELSESARSIEARKAVLKRISFSVDHMASGETPYVKTGEGWDGEGRFIDWLNALYAEELAKLEPVGLEKRGAVHPAVEPADKGLLKLIQKTGTRVRLQTSSGKPKGRIMTRLSMDQMLAVLDNPATPGMSEESHRVILRELARVMPDYTFMVGDRTMLGQWRAVTHPELEDPMDIDFGQTDPQLGVIFVANAAAETILHEMLHGALGTVLTNHYAGIGKALSGTQTSAIRNLERLMRQFADMDFSLEDPATRKAAAQVQMEIRNWLGEGFEYLNQTQEEGGDLLVLRRAGALSEFIAWTLTNQNLRKVLSKSKVRVALIKLKDAVLDGLRKLLGFPERVPLDVFSNIAWNAGALVHTLESYARQQSQASLSLSGPLLNQRNPDRAASPSVDRMRDLRRSFEAKVGVHLRSLPVSQQLIEDTTIYTLADAALNRFHASGFRFTPEQASTFRVIQAALASSMKIAPGAMAQTQKVFEHFMKDLSVESLMKDRTNDFERSLAEDKFNAIVGKTGTEWDRHGRSNLLSSVLALAMVDEDFRKVLEQSELPKDRSIRYTSVDEFLTSAGESLINTLGTAISEDGRLLGGTSNTREALDRLAQVLSRIESDDRGSIEKQAYQAMDGSEAKARSLMEGLGSRLADWGSANRVENPRSLRELT